MIEYLYDCIRATAGTTITIAARVVDNDDNAVTDDCMLLIHLDEQDIHIHGELKEDTWYFTIPAETTEGINGRYWYCVKHGDEQLCFKQPIYFI